MKPLQGIKQFFIRLKKGERTKASQQTSRPTRSSSPSRRRSLFGLNGLRSSSKSKKREDGETAERVVENQSDRRKRKTSPLDERKQQLGGEIDELNREILRFNERFGRKTTELQDLKAQDDKEKWEDELFETRLKELQSALPSIDPRSSVSTVDVQRQIEELNQDIAAIASLAAQTRTMTKQVNLDDIKSSLGDSLLVMFQALGSAEDEQQLVQMILQVFLVRSCGDLINSWEVGNPTLGTLLDRIYDRIRSKEEQMVAGKWRQITFTQLLHGYKAEFLLQHAEATATRVLMIASYAGWGGDAQDIHKRVSHLMEKAERIRVNTKAGVLSADLQPSVAAYGRRYEPSWMDANHHFGIGRVEDPKRCTVLGSLTLGLKVRRMEEDAILRSSEAKTRVLFIESFRAPGRTSSRSA